MSGNQGWDMGEGGGGVGGRNGMGKGEGKHGTWEGGGGLSGCC